jgi:hypothetical protein
LADQFSAAGLNLFSGLLGGVVNLVIFLMVAGSLIGVAFYVRYIRKFDIEVEILSLRANIGGNKQYKIIHDKAGYMYDRTNKMYYFKLKDMKIDMVAPPFNVLIPTDKGNKIQLLQKSPDEFTFLIRDQVIEDVVIGPDGREYRVGQIKTKQLEGDVGFWNIKRKSLNKNIFNPESTLMKLLPYIVPVLMFMLVIFLTWMVLKNFSVLGDVAESLRQTAEVIKSTTTASVTTVNP